MIHRTAIIGGERIEVTWSVAENALEATMNGRTYKLEFRQVGDGAYWFGWNGLSIQALVTPQDQGYIVSIGGNRIPVEFLESAKKSRRHGGVSDGLVEVRAPMPGKIVRILCATDDRVESRQGIVVMEAMKMQNEIRSPKAGRVVQLNVKEGDAVKLGDLIAQVE